MTKLSCKEVIIEWCLLATSAAAGETSAFRKNWGVWKVTLVVRNFLREHHSMLYNVRFTWSRQKIAMTSVLWSENWCAIKWKCHDLKPFPFFLAKWVVTISYMFHSTSPSLNRLPTVIRGEILSSCRLSEGYCRTVPLRMVYRKILFLSSRAEERGTNEWNQTTTSPKLNSNNCPNLQIRLFT